MSEQAAEIARLVKLSSNGDSWSDLLDDWERQATDLGENFDRDVYPNSLFSPLLNGGDKNAGIFALKSGGTFLAACQLNAAYLPNYTEPVLRMRHLTVCPTLDLSDDGGESYGRALVDVFFEVVNLCMEEGDMAAKHIKFHLPSPADRQFFAAVGRALQGKNVFGSVESKGAWLYISF